MIPPCQTSLPAEPCALAAGLARVDITAFDPAMCLFGWGHPDNHPTHVHKPLYARALAVEHAASGRRLVYVCCDLGMIAESMRTHVLPQVADLGLGEAEVMLTATHTHSGPSGFSTYLYYGLSGPGFSRQVHDRLVAGVVAAIRQAVAALQPAHLRVVGGDLPVEAGVAFNRAVRSYNQNPDVTPVARQDRAAAVERRMTVLRVDAQSGQPLGLVSWFGVHCTTVHRDCKVIHPDHKGEAATFLETRAATEGQPGYVAIFAQTAPGDVTPNVRFSSARGFNTGPADDDLESAARLGRQQAEHAAALAESALRQPPIAALPFAAAIRYVDFFSAPADPRFTDGQPGRRSSKPVLGWAYTAGTLEGPGPFQRVHRLTTILSRWSRPLALSALPLSSPATDADASADAESADGLSAEDLAMHGRKFPFIQLFAGRQNRLCGLIRADSRLLGLVKNPYVNYFRRAMAESDAAYSSWVPRYLPVQILILGPLCIAALPMEPTVQSGRRIAAAVAEALGLRREQVVVNGYANAYAGYVATPQEYAEQRYEGSATLFGQWSLPAFCTAFSRLATTARPGLHSAPPPRSIPTPGADDIGRRPPLASLSSALPASP